MDPSICASPTFRVPEPRPNPNTQEVSEDVSNKLKEALERVKKDLIESEFESPHPVIEIKRQRKQCIVVKEVETIKNFEMSNFSHSDSSIPLKPLEIVHSLVIFRNTDSEDNPLFKIDTDKFHHVQFSSLEDCRVFVLTKTVRVFFMRCTNCQVSVRKPLLGALEFFKCKNLQLNIRIPETPEITESLIPVVSIEDCNKVDIYQSNKELFYVIKLCIDITGNIVDSVTKQRYSKYNLGKLFWGEQEQSCVLLSRTNGFQMTTHEYKLENIEHNLMIQQLNSENDNSEFQIAEIFGTTPPVVKDSPLRNWQNRNK
jgi:hypothetical protein